MLVIQNFFCLVNYKRFLAALGMTFQFWWVREEESSGALCAPLLSSSPIKKHNVIPNVVKRNEESLCFQLLQ